MDDPDMWWDTLPQERKDSIMRWLTPGARTNRGPHPDDVPFPGMPEIAADDETASA